MLKSKTDIIILPIKNIMSSNETTLFFANKFANKYGLTPPKTIIRKDLSKPYFDCDEIFFSISHSGDYWVCAISNYPIGVDIQKHQPCAMDLITKRFFHRNEQEWVKKNGVNGFFNVFAAKESYVKYTGEGITDFFAEFSVVNNDDITICNKAYLKFIPFKNDYSLCLCSEKEAIVTLIENN